MSNDPKLVRTWSRNVSSLMRAETAELDELVAERSLGIRGDALEKARELLLVVAEVVHGPFGEQGEQAVEEALELFDRAKKGELGVEPTPEAPSEAPPQPPLPSELTQTGASTPASTPLPVASAEPHRPAGASPWSAGAIPLAMPPAGTPPVGPPSVAPPVPPPVALSATPVGGVSPALASPRMREPEPPLAPRSPPVGTASSDGPRKTESLPFSDEKRPAPQSAVSSLEPNPMLGSTAPASSRRAKRPATPFQKQAASAAPPESAAVEPPLTLERYAQFCVERKLWPHDTNRLTRFQIDAEAEAQSDRHYQELFSRDPVSRHRWHQLCHHHEQHLKQLRGL
ncbi:MAG: hypothetical protein AAGA56_26835 [Myxococcota bacterium]